MTTKRTDTTRRQLLTIAAGGAVAGLIPTAALTAAPVIDPIFAAIEAHRKVNAVAQADWAEVNRLYELADKKVGQDRKDTREALRGRENAIGKGSNAVAYRAEAEFAETVPTTLAGLLAMILYANELDDQDPELFNDCQLSLATAAEVLIGGQS